MFRIYDGRKEFFQWDLNQKLIVNDSCINEVHFCNKIGDCSLVCETYLEGGLTIVDVPNIILQDYLPIRAYAYSVDHTKTEEIFIVNKRSKPADYIYTETEVKRYEKLEERIAALEEGGVSGYKDVSAECAEMTDKDCVTYMLTLSEGKYYCNHTNYIFYCDVIYNAVGNVTYHTIISYGDDNIYDESIYINGDLVNYVSIGKDGKYITVGEPFEAEHAANKAYVDTEIAKAKEELGQTEVNLDGAEYRKSLTVGTSARNFNSFDYNAEDFITVKKFLAAPSKTEWLFGLYDELMTQYPDYITRTQIAETAEPITFYSSNKPEHTANYMPDVSEFTAEYMNVGASAVSYGASSGVKTSPFIEVPIGKVLSIQYLNGKSCVYVSSVRAIAAFDADYNFISGVNNAANGGMFTIPSNAKYIRVAVMKNYVDNFATVKTMFVVNNDGALLSDYVANGEELPVRTGLKTGIPMYRYDFKPPIASETIARTAKSGQTPIIPKILYVGGIHGGEYLTTMAAFRFFKMMCDRWKEEELLSDLFWNVHFVVIPTANPFGYEYPSKRFGADGSTMGFRNEHGIDVSGNFPSDNYVENEGSVYKYGKAPLTEPESIALYNIICNEEFILSIDNHNFNHIAGVANKDKMGSYLIANQFIPNSINFWWKISRCLNPKLRILSPKVASNYDAIQVWTDSRHQMLNNTFRSVSANIEMSLGIDPEQLYKEEGVSSMDEETQAFCVDTFAVVFHEALRDFYTY